jgi:hypothetical protein
MTLSSQRTRSAGRLAGGLFKVIAATLNTLQFQTPENAQHTRIASAKLVPALAELGNIQSGFMLNEKDGVALSDTFTTLSGSINKGYVPAVVDVDDTSNFPDAPGYIVFGFGGPRQSNPIHYIGVASSTQIRLDPNEKLNFNYGSGSTVSLLLGRGVFAPANSIELNVSWLTDSSIGRVEAQKDLNDVVGVGLNITNRILYPGDRGLGNEGLPKNGVTKISDAVTIWGSDEYLIEAQTAREGD